jgi:hypothetical protein
MIENFESLLAKLKSGDGLLDSEKDRYFEPHVSPQAPRRIIEFPDHTEWINPHLQIPEYLFKKDLLLGMSRTSLYHGTSIEALENIIKTGWIKTAYQLIKARELCSGELVEKCGDNFDEMLKSPKFIPIDRAMALFQLSADDPDLYQTYGNGHLISFAPTPSRAQAYANLHQQPAIIECSKETIESSNNQITFYQREGTYFVHQNIDFTREVYAIYVPQNMVEDIAEKVEGKSTCIVLPLSFLK